MSKIVIITMKINDNNNNRVIVMRVRIFLTIASKKAVKYFLNITIIIKTKNMQ
jgi:hypothetical protein